MNDPNDLNDLNDANDLNYPNDLNDSNDLNDLNDPNDLNDANDLNYPNHPFIALPDVKSADHFFPSHHVPVGDEFVAENTRRVLGGCTLVVVGEIGNIVPFSENLDDKIGRIGRYHFPVAVGNGLAFGAVGHGVVAVKNKGAIGTQDDRLLRQHACFFHGVADAAVENVREG